MIASRQSILIIGCLLMIFPYQLFGQRTSLLPSVRRALTFAHEQSLRTAETFRDLPSFPRSTDSTGTWIGQKAEQWTSGFFPGILWMLFGETGSERMLADARLFTSRLEHLKDHGKTHDIGFIVFSSFGRGFRLTNEPAYKDVIVQAARTLAGRFSPAVGAIKSWDNRAWEYPVIIDNMMNLELLLWAGQQADDMSLVEVAVEHARTTMRDHIRPDGSTYHVVSYDTATGKVLERVTHQGAFDESAWARGQAWAVYGFTMVSRYTESAEFLSTAEAVSDFFVANLPADHVPYWDFRAPGIPGTFRDASAAAIAASGLLELSQLASSDAKRVRYRTAAENILSALCAPPYLAEGSSSQGILNHTVGHMPKMSEVDVSLIYADYYFVEALLRYMRLHEEEVFEEVRRLDNDRILSVARRELERAPVTITAFPASRSAGDIHDFYSEGDYWWPDSTNPDGPYVRRDGQTNPDNFVAHRQAMIAFADAVSTLTAAYVLSGDARYAEHAIRHMRAWFVDASTYMRPSLEHAQAIFGRVTGRGIGIIDTIHLIDIARAVHILGTSGDVPAGDLEPFRAWFRSYLVWLTTHEYGKTEMEAKNNHGTWWVAQAAAFAEAAEDRRIQSLCADRYMTILLPGQMGERGEFPLELSRTKPYNYALFNLEGMALIAHILARPDRDLWTFELPDGRSLIKGMNFMLPYVPDKSSWPYPRDVMYYDQYPGRHSSFLFAAGAIGPEPWFDVWKRLDPLPANDEVRRSLPVVQPMLWTIPRTHTW